MHGSVRLFLLTAALSAGIRKQPRCSSAMFCRFLPPNAVPATGPKRPVAVVALESLDYRGVAARADVASFLTEPLQGALTIAGPLQARLWVKADTPSAELGGANVRRTCQRPAAASGARYLSRYGHTRADASHPRRSG